jgi:hypothetical protein
MFNHHRPEMRLQFDFAPRGFEATNFGIEYGAAEGNRKAGVGDSAGGTLKSSGAQSWILECYPPKMRHHACVSTLPQNSGR